jgi:hypothetical protein
MADQEKRTTVGISLMPSLLEAIDAHLSELNQDRSSYFRRLAQADLAAAGKLPGSTIYNVRELAAQAADVIGADKVIAMLTALGGEKLTSAGSQKEIA